MEQENLLDDVLPEHSNLVRRRALLPWWMKVFIWIFIVMGGISIPILIMGILGTNTTVSMYGLESHQAISFVGLILISLFLLKGIVSYGLWAEEDWAINLGYVDAIAGIAICLFVMLGMHYFSPTSGFTFRLELLLLVPYLIKLKQLHPEWDKRPGGPIQRP